MYYNNTNANNNNKNKIISDSIGFVFQFPERHFLTETVMEEITFGLNPTTRKSNNKSDTQVRDDITRIRRAIELFDFSRLLSSANSDDNNMVNEISDLRLSSLSGGYKRRLAIAIQAAKIGTNKSDSNYNNDSSNRLLLMDEPLAGLDWQAKQSIITLIRNLTTNSNNNSNNNTNNNDNNNYNSSINSPGCSILIVSHEIEELKSIVDKWWEVNPSDGSINRMK